MRRTITAIALSVLAVLGVALVPTSPSVGALGAWHVIGVPRASGRFYSDPTCPSPRDCVVLVNQRGPAGVMFSDDGARHWQLASVAGDPSGLEALTCVNPSLCVAVGYRGSLASTSTLIVERSQDAGRTWSPVTLPAPYQVAHPGNQLEAVACASTLSCVALGQAAGNAPPPPSSGCSPPTCVASGVPMTYGPVVLTSADGGLTWAAQTNAFVTFDPYFATCSAGAPCQAVGIGLTACVPTGAGATRCGAAGAVLGEQVAAGAPGTPSGSSSPPSATWASESIPPGVFALNGVTCLSAATCLAVGQSADSTLGHGVVLVTSDGGRLWRSLHAPANSNSLMSISCVTRRLCVATGGLGRQYEPVIYETPNAGATWSVVARFPALSNIVRSSCTPQGLCLAAGVVGIGPSEYGVLLAS